MKKSELKSYIKENILSTLSVNEESKISPEDVESQKSYNDELQKTVDLQSQLGEDSFDGKGKDIKGMFAYLDLVRRAGKDFMNKEYIMTEFGLDSGEARSVLGKYASQFEEYEDVEIKEVDDDEDDKDAIKNAKAARGKFKKLDIAVKALKDIKTNMKSLARKYSKASEVEKEMIKDELKQKTSKKKELESLVAQLEKDAV